LPSYVSETIQAASEGRFGDDRALKVNKDVLLSLYLQFEGTTPVLRDARMKETKMDSELRWQISYKLDGWTILKWILER
jgi:hypothetical protein